MLYILKNKKFYRTVIALGVVVLIIVVSQLVVSLGNADKISFNNFCNGRTLNVVMDFNSADYFIHHGNVEGFSFNLISDFGNKNDIIVKILPISALAKIQSYDVDVICLRSKKTVLPKGFVYTDDMVDTKKVGNIRIVWAVRKNCDSLLLMLNNYIASHKKINHQLYNKYFDSDFSHYNFNQDFKCRGKLDYISSFDAVIKQYAANLNWDWRLLAALIYQESQFKTNVISYSGASGVMQLMPSVAEHYGVSEASSIEQHIAAGVKLLKNFRITLNDSLPEPHKIFFLIASYNAGAGYINTVRVETQKKGENPNLWFGHVENILKDRIKQTKNNSRKKDVQVLKYVENIIVRYYHYKNLRAEK
ncbi:MAG: transglycosylase SLT domain-containing protein [Bacteroidales bacterium]|jgi:membrane-bound lytic murein transglycosylase MltF|nr:transglycosylase SLT domain-containing protein [Bacteroidales bacterium]